MSLITIRKLYDHVYAQLDAQYPRDTLVDFRSGNHIGEYLEGYLWDTPHGYWNGQAFVPRSHSDFFADKIKTVIGSAETLVDITTMKSPTGRFWNAIKGGLVEIAKRGKTVHARILIGFPVDYEMENLEAKLAEIAEALKDHLGYITVDLGHYRYFTIRSWPEGWNHSKIIAVDGKFLMTGGHNLWDADYLELSPVFDLSMKVDGPIAVGGHIFANRLWKFTADFHGDRGTESRRMLSDGRITKDKPRLDIIPLNAPPVGTLPAMWVTNTGRGVFKHSVTGKEIIVSTMVIAFLKALETASHCRISQQSFGSLWLNWSGANFEVYNHGEFLPFPVIYHQNRVSENWTWHAFDYRIIDGLANFLDRKWESGNIVLEIFMSPPYAAAEYHNGEAPVAILDLLAHRLHELGRTVGRKEMTRRLNVLVKLNWPAITPICLEPPCAPAVTHWRGDMKYPMATHAKFWMMDDTLLYVGSENMYPCLASRSIFNPVGGLQEFGFILEADATVRDLIVGQYHRLAMTYGFRRRLLEVELTSPYFASSSECAEATASPVDDGAG